MLYTLKANAKTVHIAGIDAVSQGEFTYAANACGSLTRGRFSSVGQTESITEALAMAEAKARATGRQVCKNCRAAAERVIEAEAAQAAAELAAQAEAEVVTEVAATVTEVAATVTAEVTETAAPIVAELNGRAPVWMELHQGRQMWAAQGAPGLYTSKERAQAAHARLAA